MHSQAEVCISNQSNAYIYTHTRLHIRAQRTAETPPASPAPSVSLSVLHSHAQTGPQQSQCEISCLCGALSACACLFGCTSTLGLDAYFRTYLQSVCQEVTHVGFQKCACVCVYIREVMALRKSTVSSKGRFPRPPSNHTDFSLIHSTYTSLQVRWVSVYMLLSAQAVPASLSWPGLP